ncbi:SRPBCC domain-containing protein [Streptomyces sp. NPDC058683]|uniref:SRPBCC family protein n=1 Tax=Streptomyces sp. NPDC058683 TaxID=3346597 RepID=UPI00365575A1
MDRFLPYPPAKVWRALTEPDPLVQRQMQEAVNVRLEVGHRYRAASVPRPGAAVPRPGAAVPGVVDVRVLARDPEWMPSVQWSDPDPAGLAHWTITWTLEHQGRGTRLFLVHEGFDPDDPAQMVARKIMDGAGGRMSVQLRGRRWSSLGKAGVKAVTGGTPRVHVHLLMHLHVNGVMIRVS